VTVSRRLDLLPLCASVLTAAVTALYVYLVLSQGSRPSWYALTILVVCVAASGYAVRPKAPHRRPALVVSAIGLVGLGYVALFSIGLPLLLSGALCVAAALRHRPDLDRRDTV
jgi:drug/metabolite transporter (DMT)-like permease